MDVEAAVIDPQRWNRYAYSLNSPYVYGDHDGRNPYFLQRVLQTPLVQRMLASPALRPVVRSIEKLSDKLLDAVIRAPRPAIPPDAGRSVIGSFPQYIRLADQMGARRFQIPIEVWNRMSDAQRWEANRTFLDRGIARGDVFVLTDKVSRLLVEGGRWTKEEIKYLLTKGYTIGADGASLVPPK
jgi:hypothetical protein